MKKAGRFLLGATALLVLYSCKKEYSLEGGVAPPVPGNTLATCNIQLMSESDKNTKAVEYVYRTAYDADNKASSIEVVDSLRGQVSSSFAVSRTNGRTQVDLNQYFIIGSDGKITEFHGHEYPEDNTSDRFNVKYSYNASGQLTKRTEEYDVRPGVTSFEMNYSYTGNNLTRAEANVFNGTGLQKFITVSYEYETTKTIKNFLYLHAVAPEIFYFQTAIDAGKNSVNPVKKVTTTFLQYSNGRDSTAVTNFVNYSINAKGQVVSFEVTGDDFTLSNLHTGKKYAFNYSCF